MTINRNLLDDVPDAPAGKREKNGSVADWDSVFDRIFISLMQRLLENRGMMVGELFTITDLKSLGYSRANALGTWLGWGVGAEGNGLRLHRDKKHRIVPCQENLNRLISVATDEQVDRLLTALGIDSFAALVERIKTLPAIKPVITS